MRNHIYSLAAAAAAAFFIAPSCGLALENFHNNPTTIYPSGCATLLQMSPDVQGPVELLIDTDTLWLWDTDAGIQVPAEVTVYRMGCTEENRSLVLVNIYVPNIDDGVQSTVRVPLAFGNIGGTIYPLRLESEPNNHLVDNELLIEGSGKAYFLDGRSLEQNPYGFDNWMNANQYNNGFDIYLVDAVSFGGSFNGYDNTIPAYHDELHASSMPINGRLSGAWVTPGAEDQGFVISFSELFDGADLLSMIFLSWYTFDQAGNPIWLVGNTLYDLGDRSVTVELLLVENGQFLGSKKADRTAIGEITLHVRSCTQIDATYQLSQLGLGQGNFILTRVFDMETAGYTCQDLGRRVIQ